MSPAPAGVHRTLRWTLATAGLVSACGRASPPPPLVSSSPAVTLPPGDYEPREERDILEVGAEALPVVRREALLRARVWTRPAMPVEQADLGQPAVPAHDLRRDTTLDCRFVLKSSGGRTPKFSCVRAGGDVLKVKYGRNNPEVFAEVAATRLFAALGFGADTVHVVSRVRCFGCPPFPYPKASVLDALRMDESRVVEFDYATVERRRPGLALGDGWGFDELDQLDPRQGGATRAERDALRLLAALVGHWDAKPENQRLLCDESTPAAGPCSDPLAYVHDLGQTFGPKSMELEGWRDRPVWSDARECRLSMKGMPYDGATFGEPRITEEGRALFASLLGELTDGQLRALFTLARFAEYFRNTDEAKDVGAWVAAFRHRQKQVEDARCPPAP